jgi:hypothetical protein
MRTVRGLCICKCIRCVPYQPSTFRLSNQDHRHSTERNSEQMLKPSLDVLLSSTCYVRGAVPPSDQLHAGFSRD